MKYSIYFLLVSLLIGCAEKTSQETQNEILEQIVSEKVKEYDIDQFLLEDSHNLEDIWKCSNNIKHNLSSKDSIQFYTKSTNPQKFRNFKIPRLKVIDSDSIKTIFSGGIKTSLESWGNFKTKYEENIFFTLSPPIIFSNGDKCLIYIAVNCGGLCGEGSILLLKKNWIGNWHIYKEIECWVS